MIISNKLRNKCLPFFSLFNPLMLLLIRVIRKKNRQKIYKFNLVIIINKPMFISQMENCFNLFFFYFTWFTRDYFDIFSSPIAGIPFFLWTKSVFFLFFNFSCQVFFAASRFLKIFRGSITQIYS